MIFIFLDMDGVLNNHHLQSNGYGGLNKECVENLNKILDAVPETYLVISSSWRYMIPNSMSLTGFEYLLLVGGVNCKGRVFGYTRHDLDENDTRGKQIADYVASHQCDKYVAIDDIPEGFKENKLVYVQTNPKTGLTDTDAKSIIEYFNL
jgi:hypothetical protein